MENRAKRDGHWASDEMEIPRQCPRPREKASPISGTNTCACCTHTGMRELLAKHVIEKAFVDDTKPHSESVLRECHVCLRKPTTRAVARHGARFSSLRTAVCPNMNRLLHSLGPKHHAGEADACVRVMARIMVEAHRPMIRRRLSSLRSS